MPTPKPSWYPLFAQPLARWSTVVRSSTASLTARTAGSGHGTGSLKNTISASPRNLAGGDDQLRHLARQKTPEAPQAFELRHLRCHLLLERPVPLHELLRL